MMPADTNAFSIRIAQLHGPAGLAWLESLPGILAECALRWSLELQPPFDNLSYNHVAPGIQSGGRKVVLKVGFVKEGTPDKEFLSEHDALVHFAGRGIVRLLDADLTTGVMLLERLIPGTSLKSLADEEEATAVAAGVMKALWKSPPDGHAFPSVADWSTGLRRLRFHFDGGYGPFPARLVDMAKIISAELIPSMEAVVLLHGDLHHDNVLMSQRQPWLGIDPKGVIGEPAYEPGAFLRNIPLCSDERQARKQLSRAIDQFAGQLMLDRQRIVRWGFAQAVLSAWWSYEDHGQGWEPALAVAELLNPLM